MKDPILMMNPGQLRDEIRRLRILALAQDVTQKETREEKLYWKFVDELPGRRDIKEDFRARCTFACIGLETIVSDAGRQDFRMDLRYLIAEARQLYWDLK